MKETHYDLDTNKQRPATQAEPDRLTANSASITPGHGCKDISVSVTAESTVELVTHNPSGVNVWYALLIDGVHHDLVMAKFTSGRPELTAALDKALKDVESAIAVLSEQSNDTQAATPIRIITQFDIIAARQRVVDAEAAGEQISFSTGLLGCAGVSDEAIRYWMDAEPRIDWCACEGGDNSRIVCTECGLPPYWPDVSGDDEGDSTVTLARPAEPLPVFVEAELVSESQTNLTTVLHLDGQEIEIIHRSIAERDAYLKANPGAYVPWVQEWTEARLAAYLAQLCTRCPHPATTSFSGYPLCDACANAAVERVFALLQRVCPSCGDGGELCPACREVGETTETCKLCGAPAVERDETLLFWLCHDHKSQERTWMANRDVLTPPPPPSNPQVLTGCDPLLPLIRMVLDAWVENERPTPYDTALTQLANLVWEH